jgi:serine/threonine protein kinase
MLNRKEEASQKIIIFNKFQLVQKLGEGSFGKIYIAEHIQTHEQVALKMEPKEIGQSLLETEAYILCYLKGGNILNIIYIHI